MIGIWTLVSAFCLVCDCGRDGARLLGVLDCVAVSVRLADWRPEPLSVSDHVPGESAVRVGLSMCGLVDRQDHSNH